MTKQRLDQPARLRHVLGGLVAVSLLATPLAPLVAQAPLTLQERAQWRQQICSALYIPQPLPPLDALVLGVSQRPFFCHPRSRAVAGGTA